MVQSCEKGFSVFQDQNGDWSSKRVFGLLCLAAAIVGLILGRDPVVVGEFLAAATAVFLGQAITRT